MHTEETRARAYQKIKQRRIDWFFLNGPCRLCGLWDRLELDHIDPIGKISHNIWSWSEARRITELLKCQPLCYFCHKEKHSGPKHGVTGYSKGCRCRMCTDEKWKLNSKWRQLKFGSLSSHNRVSDL